MVGAGQKSGQYRALDPDTGAVRWVTQAGPGGTAGGLQWGSAVDDRRVYTANGVVFGCTLDPSGHMCALDGAIGQVFWQFASGGSCLSGAAISSGEVYWGSGYGNFGFGTPNNRLYAFGLK